MTSQGETPPDRSQAILGQLKRIVPVALKTAKPGTPEFREALRQAMTSEKDIAASQGVYNFTEKDRYGLDDRSRIILTVKDGKYTPAK